MAGEWWLRRCHRLVIGRRETRDGVAAACSSSRPSSPAPNPHINRNVHHRIARATCLGGDQWRSGAGWWCHTYGRWRASAPREGCWWALDDRFRIEEEKSAVAAAIAARDPAYPSSGRLKAAALGAHATIHCDQAQAKTDRNDASDSCQATKRGQRASARPSFPKTNMSGVRCRKRSGSLVLET